MKKYLLVLYISILILSCKKKEVKVPLVARQGEEEVANNSAIWFFYDNGKLDLNEHNRITSTNWFFNIDKKLALKEVIPEVIRLQKKHREKSPHNTKPMKDYFTYVNTLNSHLSFYNFDSITYLIQNKKDIPTTKKDTALVFINSDVIKVPNNLTVLQLIFDGNSNFQDYLSAKAKLEKQHKQIASIEYISVE